jgi:putative transposase
MDIRRSEAETFWTAFLRKLARPGLRGPSSSSPTLTRASRRLSPGSSQPPGSAAASTPCATPWPMPAAAAGAWSRPSSPPPSPRTIAEQATARWRRVTDQLRLKVPKLAALMGHAEPDVLAYMSFPPQHRAKLHSTNPLERLNGEKRRTEVVGILPNAAHSTRWRHFCLSRITSGPSNAPATSPWKASLPVSEGPSVGLPIAAG